MDLISSIAVRSPFLSPFFPVFCTESAFQSFLLTSIAFCVEKLTESVLEMRRCRPS